MDSIVLENSFLRCEWLPEYGSKLVSLKTKNQRNSRELLHQSKTRILTKPEYGADFSKYDMSGFDECFPTIDACPSPIHKQSEIMIPDHGELWTLPWEVTSCHKTGVTFSVQSPQFGYQLNKSITLNNRVLTHRYEVTIIGDQEFLPFIWTPHALFQVNSHLQFIIPSHMDEIVTVSDNSGALGDNRTVHRYPITEDKYQKPLNLSEIEPRSAGNCEKYYFLNRLKEGDNFGFRDEFHEVIMNVDSDKVPYLGVWKNQGGFNQDYNFALEPCTGIYDNLNNAYNDQHCAVIQNGETYTWSFSMRVGSI